MLKKTIDKEKRKQRKTWVGLYTRITPTKNQRKQKALVKETRKIKQSYC